jgi:hypothetical protein
MEAGVALDYFFGWGARHPRRVIHFGVDRLGPLWTGSLMENFILIERDYPISE